MQLKAFEAGRYDDSSIVIRNPENGKQELFTEEEFEIVKFLKQNENESLLALLLPNIGVAKRDHIVVCMKVLGKLKRMQIVDYYAITGRKSASQTATLDMDLQREKIKFTGLRSLAASLFAFSDLAFGWMGANLLLLLSLGLASFSFLFFPFERVDVAIQENDFSYGTLFLVIYVVASLALSLRSLLQSAFLRASERRSAEHGLAFFFPLLSLRAEKKEINLVGFGARIQMAFLGLLAPMAFSALFTGLVLAGRLDPVTGFFAFSACVGATLLAACPFLPTDVADIMHVIFLRDELKERVSSGLRDIFRTKGSLSREMLFGLVASFVWLLAWLDCLRTFWDAIATNVSMDFLSPPTVYEQIGSAAAMALLLGSLLMPASIFLWGFLREKFLSKKTRIVVQKDKVKDSLSFEERMTALEKIPLFAYLNDQERLSLLNEMQPAFFQHGDFLMHQGEVGKEFFVLVKGHANAYFTDMQGRNYLLAGLREGDAFGEIALIDDVPRTASIVSDRGCITLVLKKDGFVRFSESLGSPDRVKTLIRLTSFFRRHPLFSRLGVREQAQLIDSFRFETIISGEEIPNNEENFYVIYSGKVRLDVGDDAADTVLVSDDCFGYADGIKGRYYAVEGTGLLSVKREEFHSLIWEKLVERPELFF